MDYILIGNNGIESMKLVVTKMTQPINLIKWSTIRQKFLKYDPTKNAFIKFEFEPIDKLIRWGNHIHFPYHRNHELNKSSQQSLASNKRDSRLLLQVNGVSVPSTISYDDLINCDPQYPYIARPSHHHGGSDFFVINNRRDELINMYKFNDTWYFQKIINKTNEYRVHVAHGKVLAINEKVLSSTDDLRANQAVTEASWGEVIPWSAYNHKMCLLACNAVKTIGLDYGAVDIMFDGIEYYVAEINTSPSICEDYISSRYARYFDWWLRFTNNPFDYTQWSVGKSFAWKNYQLNGENQNVDSD